MKELRRRPACLARENIDCLLYVYWIVHGIYLGTPLDSKGALSRFLILVLDIDKALGGCLGLVEPPSLNLPLKQLIQLSSGTTFGLGDQKPHSDHEG